MDFRDLVITGHLEPETMKSQVLCSEQYKYLFNSIRIPEIPEDTTLNSDPFKYNHIVVLRKNQFYKLNLVHSDGSRLNLSEVEQF